MSFHSTFDAVFVINLERRLDRWREVQHELTVNCGLDAFIPWLAYDSPDNGHNGCTRSHRELVAHVAESGFGKVLVLEDDTALITRARLHSAGFREHQQVWKAHCSILNGEGDLVERFNSIEPYLPPQWDVLYLGAGYGEPPISRYSPHCVRCGFMQTTSSYGITRDFARKWTDMVNSRYPTLDDHPGPIDNLFGSFAKDHLYYCLQPRLMFQRASKSDITGETNSYLFSMTDPVHEAMV